MSFFPTMMAGTELKNVALTLELYCHAQIQTHTIILSHASLSPSSIKIPPNLHNIFIRRKAFYKKITHSYGTCFCENKIEMRASVCV